MSYEAQRVLIERGRNIWNVAKTFAGRDRHLALGSLKFMSRAKRRDGQRAKTARRVRAAVKGSRFSRRFDEVRRRALNANSSFSV
jgi:hypothetical protein